jgi:hypothetical protein
VRGIERLQLIEAGTGLQMKGGWCLRRVPQSRVRQSPRARVPVTSSLSASGLVARLITATRLLREALEGLRLVASVTHRHQAGSRPL